MPDDYKKLGLGGLTSLVTNIKVSRWGNEVLLELVYDPTEKRIPYSLVFQNCQKIQWEVLHGEDATDIEADLIGIHLGEEGDRKAAVIHTDIFEISLLYGKMKIYKDRVDEYYQHHTTEMKVKATAQPL
ncbi:MAG TPA: hypothetical protein IGS52_23255 [Oscillatoriaceae cyanobacterium M33_DOE_052]|uniref:Uncharacterized protein n=1 Tax=Planktothricoides sp. SpSt-374 TaxID=2282167 RepID=A0A7C3ZMW9_9CYAN|nr:hypothetical protein [Oscillatoriaceae cyanobacterium M33_DOE_052]